MPHERKRGDEIIRGIKFFGAVAITVILISIVLFASGCAQNELENENNGEENTRAEDLRENITNRTEARKEEIKQNITNRTEARKEEIKQNITNRTEARREEIKQNITNRTNAMRENLTNLI